MCRSGGSGGKYLLPYHAAGEACVAPGGREVSIFFPITPPESMCRSGGSGGKYLLPHHAAGGACVAPGGRVVGIFSTIVPPEERVSFRGGREVSILFAVSILLSVSVSLSPGAQDGVVSLPFLAWV